MYLGTSADKHPDKPALIFADRDVVVTYRELEERSNRLAHAFRAWGLKPGDGIAVMLTNEEHFFVTASKDQLRIKFKVGDNPMFRKDFDASTWNSVFSVYQSIGVAVLHYQGTWGSTGGA